MDKTMSMYFYEMQIALVKDGNDNPTLEWDCRFYSQSSRPGGHEIWWWVIESRPWDYTLEVGVLDTPETLQEGIESLFAQRCGGGYLLIRLLKKFKI